MKDEDADGEWQRIKVKVHTKVVTFEYRLPKKKEHEAIAGQSTTAIDEAANIEMKAELKENKTK